MLKQLVSCLLIALLAAGSVTARALPSGNTEKEQKRAADVKAALAKLGTGEQARVSVKLRDKTKLSGYISAFNEESFAVADLKTGATTEVAFPNVAQVKGNNLSTGAKIAIGALIAAGVIIAILVAKRCNNEGGCF